jgi:hypothetical protein
LLVVAGAAPAAAQLPVAADSGAAVSENPVKSNQVVISWPAPAGTGDARLAVYSFLGERLFTTTVAAPTNEYVWDLTLDGGGRRLVNGAYIVVVDVGGRHYRRRLFVARPSP